MFLQKISRYVCNIVLIILLVTGLPACVQQNDIDDDPCPNIFNLEILSEGGSAELLSDLCVHEVINSIDYCTYFNDPVFVTIENLPKNPGFTTTTAMDAVINKYYIYYVRRDEGTRVPRPISHRVNWVVPIDSQVAFEFSIVTHEMKMEPPLSDLLDDGFDRETGNFTIETDAHVIFNGETRAGCKFWLEGIFPVKFADFAD